MRKLFLVFCEFQNAIAHTLLKLLGRISDEPEAAGLVYWHYAKSIPIINPKLIHQTP